MSASVLYLQSIWTCCEKLSASGKWIGDDQDRGHRSSSSYLKARDFTTAVSSEHIPIIEGKLDTSNVKFMLDSGSSVLLIDKAYLPLSCVVRRRQQPLRTADGYRMGIVGSVKLMAQFGSHRTEHKLLVADQLLMPIILGLGFLSKHAV